MSSEHGHGHGDHGSPFIQHHFDGAEHQFNTGKFAIWCFLAQEVLFFSALFVAYIILRTQHPEVFDYAHYYLDWKLGALNTVVLLFSSLTAAWAVRAAQLNQQKILIGCLLVTLLCAFGFLGVKYVEYSHKAHIGTLFGHKFAPKEHWDGTPFPEIVTKNPPSSARSADEMLAYQELVEKGEAPELPPVNTSMFFTIYFLMTGLHGIHVIAGIFVFIWLLYRAFKGHFGPTYYGPVDYAALYWHLVDLIWIFLFPLFYLI
jgi:cytochrome c oxidase subunit III